MKTKLTLPNGATYGVDKDGNRVCTGSQMGRCNVLPASTHPKLRLQRLPLIDGAYDKGGAYWGAPANLFCAWDDEGTRLFLRAETRHAAKAKILNDWPQATFYR